MAYYTRKPELVAAIQWTGDNLQEIKDFVGNEAHIQCNGDDMDTSNVVVICFYYRSLCTLLPYDYLIKHDFSDRPDLFSFEVMNEHRFKAYYQPDSCNLDESDCE